MIMNLDVHWECRLTRAEIICFFSWLNPYVIVLPLPAHIDSVIVMATPNNTTVSVIHRIVTGVGSELNSILLQAQWDLGLSEVNFYINIVPTEALMHFYYPESKINCREKRLNYVLRWPLVRSSAKREQAVLKAECTRIPLLRLCSYVESLVSCHNGSLGPFFQ